MTMTKTEAQALLQTKRGQIANDSALLDLVSELLTSGWQAEQATIDAGVSAGIATAVQDAVAPLNARIADLEAQLVPAPDVIPAAEPAQ